MLKRSKIFKHLLMSEKVKKQTILLFAIVDKTIQTDYQKVFYFIYLDPKGYKLSEVENQCHMSHSMLNGYIHKINSFIDNIEFHFATNDSNLND